MRDYVKNQLFHTLRPLYHPNRQVPATTCPGLLTQYQSQTLLSPHLPRRPEPNKSER